MADKEEKRARRWLTDKALRDDIWMIASLADLIRDAVRAEREACARIASEGCLVPPDGGSPTEDERLMCEGIAAAIRARGEDKADVWPPHPV